MFKKILIANRGEIALRIIRACKELGIDTVLVHSTIDENSIPVQMADEAICIGPAPSNKSYLSIPNIISAAEISDVEAIHPGYGFLAENTHFAEICESCNIKFIGPGVDSIKLMGDKARAKETMRKAGVPTIQGSDGIVESSDEALKIAKKIGYPVIIKASAGGGGRGMRVAHNDMSLVNAFMTARAEAEAAFGNSEVYIEKLIEEPRHIEFQILADSYGNTIHLGERDCTIQRRHQKLIEEAPSPMLSQGLRQKMGRSAIRAAKAAGYVNAGTVEFLLDKHGRYYFMEMNTRVQVEHPVTEEVTDVDIIEEQIRIAAGEHLRIEQKAVKINGWAFECRINAENVDKGFQPMPGTITGLHFPGGKGIRLDTHIYQGYSIPPHYDSMIGKLIASGRTREEAIARMNRALDEFVIEGIPTTIQFHKQIFNDPNFCSGNYSTHYVDEMIKRQG
ncbi:MAG: acetyl-CoA carboxylase biotin carboxylase subunit [Candidatus Theseobacter exili]|nr:acetyl-CoA carboxylase biotin carboxylase subunit [Candidatus Theseobacter exili]